MRQKLDIRNNVLKYILRIRTICETKL